MSEQTLMQGHDDLLSSLALVATGPTGQMPSDRESAPSVIQSLPQSTTQTRRFLHVGCGHARRERLPLCFQSQDWQEIRLDIDPAANPDILASMTDMPMVQDASVDAIWSSHNLEHLEGYQVPQALAEFARVLHPAGFALFNLPDLRAIAKHILADNLSRPLYQSEVGVITPHDMLFGHQRSLQQGKTYMAHRTGFTATTLGEALLAAGFPEVRVVQGLHWDLWALALMPEAAPELLDELAGVMR